MGREGWKQLCYRSSVEASRSCPYRRERPGETLRPDLLGVVEPTDVRRLASGEELTINPALSGVAVSLVLEISLFLPLTTLMAVLIPLPTITLPGG